MDFSKYTLKRVSALLTGGMKFMTYIEIGSKLFFGLIALLVVTRLLGEKNDVPAYAV